MESEDALLGSYDSEASADDSQSETILSEDDDLGAEKATLESGKPFPKDVTEKLETLYSRGMNGWGKAHKSEIDVAMTSTGLELSQIKVSLTVVTSSFRVTGVSGLHPCLSILYININRTGLGGRI